MNKFQQHAFYCADRTARNTLVRLAEAGVEFEPHAAVAVYVALAGVQIAAVKHAVQYPANDRASLAKISEDQAGAMLAAMSLLFQDETPKA